MTTFVAAFLLAPAAAFNWLAYREGRQLARLKAELRLAEARYQLARTQLAAEEGLLKLSERCGIDPVRLCEARLSPLGGSPGPEVRLASVGGGR